MLLNGIATVLLLTAAGDQPLPHPFPSPMVQPEPVSVDSASRNPVIMEGRYSGDTGRPDSTGTVSLNPDTYPLHRLLTPDGLNIETIETVTLDDDGREIRRSVKLEEHQQKMGLDLLIPGGVFGVLGTLIELWVVSLRPGEDISREMFTGTLVMTNIITASGGIFFAFGVRQLRIHARWHDRYHRDAVNQPLMHIELALPFHQ